VTKKLLGDYWSIAVLFLSCAGDLPVNFRNILRHSAINLAIEILDDLGYVSMEAGDGPEALAFLPLLASGVAPADLYQAYVEAMRTRIFEPAGMSGARIAADPRDVSADYAAGYGYDLTGTPTELPYAAFGSTAPASSAQARLADNNKARPVAIQWRAFMKFPRRVSW